MKVKKDKMNGLKIGDRVRYTAEFLRSICDYSKNSADKYGIIESFEDLDVIVLAKLNKSNLPLNVNVKNLERF